MKKILYLEADPLNIDVFRVFVSRLPPPVDQSLVIVMTTTASAGDALKHNTFDLLVSEAYPPEIVDGLEIVTDLRLGRYGKENQNIPAIAFTTMAMIGDKEKCLEAGFNAYLAKPAAPRDFTKIIKDTLPDLN